MTATLSIVLIVKNEALNLAQCLESVQDLKAEIVILDGGSTDDTEKIARIYTNKFFQEIAGTDMANIVKLPKPMQLVIG